MRVAIIFWRLILRQAQDDRLLNVCRVIFAMASRISYLVILAAWIAPMVGPRFRGTPEITGRRGADDAARLARILRGNICRACRWRTNSTRRCGSRRRGRGHFLPFQEAGHLGEDWTTAKGDAALGEPVTSVATAGSPWRRILKTRGARWSSSVTGCQRSAGLRRGVLTRRQKFRSIVTRGKNS